MWLGDVTKAASGWYREGWGGDPLRGARQNSTTSLSHCSCRPGLLPRLRDPHPAHSPCSHAGPHPPAGRWLLLRRHRFYLERLHIRARRKRTRAGCVPRSQPAPELRAERQLPGWGLRGRSSPRSPSHSCFQGTSIRSVTVGGREADFIQKFIFNCN